MKIHPSEHFDNRAQPYTRILARPLTPAIGAQICGITLNALEAEAFAEIERALCHHKMLFFRDQKLSRTDQEQLTLRFGEFGTDAYTRGEPGHPNVQPVIKEADARVAMVFGNGWHTDSPFLERPPAISILYAAEVPPVGGDTLFANTELAHAWLSPVMQQLLGPLRVHMSAADVVAVLQPQAGVRAPGAAPQKLGSIELDLNPQPMIDGHSHPLVRTHPITGKKALYVDETYALGIQGLTAAEAQPLLSFLRMHVTQPALTCRLHWEPGTLAIWDNRSCIHHAFNDFDGYRREMYRTTVRGEVPR